MKQSVIVMFGSLLLSLTGCSTEKIADYQPASSSVSERTVQESGVEVALDPFVESGRTKKYFDLDAVAAGIAILHVRITNQTTNQTFLVEKKSIQLLPTGSTVGLTGDGKDNSSSKTGTTVGKVGIATLAVSTVALSPIGFTIAEPLMLTGMAEESKSTEIQRNLTSKEMADETLSPSKSVAGFIYFMPVKKGEDWTRTAAVKIMLTETKTRQPIELSIPFSH